MSTGYFVIAIKSQVWYYTSMNCKEHSTQLKEKLRDNKLKATPARLELLDIFEHARRPLAVAELSEKLPESDRATLYRNVEVLEQLGLLKQIRFKDRQVYYEVEDKHHHHIVCTNCGKIADISHCKLDTTGKSVLKHTGFAEIDDHSLEFYGLCAACAK